MSWAQAKMFGPLHKPYGKEGIRPSKWTRFLRPRVGFKVCCSHVCLPVWIRFVHGKYIESLDRRECWETMYVRVHSRKGGGGGGGGRWTRSFGDKRNETARA